MLIFYSSRLFSRDQSVTADRGPLYLTWGIGLLNFLFAFPAYWLIESRGRRWLLLTTLPFLALCMAGAAASFKATGEAEKISVGFFTFLFTAFYSPGMGPVPFTLCAEMFPLEHRMVGMSMAVLLLFLVGGLFALFVPLIPDKSELLGTFAVLNVLAYVLVWIFVREVAAVSVDGKAGQTRSLGLEEMSRIFEFPISSHVKYQWNRKGNALRSVWDFLRGRDTQANRANDFYHHELNQKSASAPGHNSTFAHQVSGNIPLNS